MTSSCKPGSLALTITSYVIRMDSTTHDATAASTTVSEGPALATPASLASTEEREGTEQNLVRERTHHSEGTTVVGGGAAGGAAAERVSTGVELAKTHTEHGCPRLDFTFKWKVPVLYFLFLLTFNLVIPCLLYYLLEVCEWSPALEELGDWF